MTNQILDIVANGGLAFLGVAGLAGGMFALAMNESEWQWRKLAKHHLDLAEMVEWLKAKHVRLDAARACLTRLPAGRDRLATWRRLQPQIESLARDEQLPMLVAARLGMLAENAGKTPQAFWAELSPAEVTELAEQTYGDHRVTLLRSYARGRFARLSPTEMFSLAKQNALYEQRHALLHEYVASEGVEHSVTKAIAIYKEIAIEIEAEYWLDDFTSKRAASLSIWDRQALTAARAHNPRQALRR